MQLGWVAALTVGPNNIDAFVHSINLSVFSILHLEFYGVQLARLSV